jgi:hypothetical protein
MMMEKQMECRLAGETVVLGENLPQCHFCPSQNPTWPDPCLNPVFYFNISLVKWLYKEIFTSYIQTFDHIALATCCRHTTLAELEDRLKSPSWSLQMRLWVSVDLLGEQRIWQPTQYSLCVWGGGGEWTLRSTSTQTYVSAKENSKVREVCNTKWIMQEMGSMSRGFNTVLNSKLNKLYFIFWTSLEISRNLFLA